MLHLCDICHLAQSYRFPTCFKVSREKIIFFPTFSIILFSESVIIIINIHLVIIVSPTRATEDIIRSGFEDIPTKIRVDFIGVNIRRFKPVEVIRVNIRRYLEPVQLLIYLPACLVSGLSKMSCTARERKFPGTTRASGHDAEETNL